MKKITEEFLHFLWANQHLAGVVLRVSENLELIVMHPGEVNRNAGPDFFNARIKINGTIWAGNVELHIHASDWLSHQHHQDPLYDSVILHVVYYNDCIITRENREKIPTAELRFPLFLWDTFETMMSARRWVPCEGHLVKIPSLHFVQWKSSLLPEKLRSNCNVLQKKYIESDQNWEALLSKEIFRCFGMPVNTIPFEMLSQAVPINILLREKQSAITTEALLFGKAGMLCGNLPEDIYMEKLAEEYKRIGLRSGKTEVQPYLWKFMRMRPASFPTIRIAMLATLIHRRYPLLEKITKRPSISDLLELFKVQASDYWNTHYLFGKVSENRLKQSGVEFIHRVLINGIVPFLFFYGMSKGSQRYKDYAIELLEMLPGECNSVIKKWNNLGVNASNAFESQSILYLYKNYCHERRCLKCQIGNYLILNGKDKP